jgi:hypothetical protein
LFSGVLGVPGVKSDAVQSSPLLVTAEKIGQLRHAAGSFWGQAPSCHIGKQE